MREQTLLKLAQDLEWLGCELEHYGQMHAHQGFPGSGLVWEAFLEKQRGVLITADKIERELKSQVRFNPSRLVGLDFPMDIALDLVTSLLAAAEEIKISASESVQKLPNKVRAFTRKVEAYLGAVSSVKP
jgi:hypothetical protein